MDEQTTGPASPNIPPSQPEQTQPKPFSPLTYIKRAVIVMFVIVCLFGVWGTFFPSKTSQPPSDAKPGTTISPTVPAVWKTFTNKKFYYSVQYPDTLEMSEETQYSTVFQVKEKHPGRLTFPALYISVIPDGFDNKQGDIYNFMSEAVINKFYVMKDTEKLLTEPGADPQYWTYTRLASIPVADATGIVIQNDTVWEGEEGVRNRRILVKKNGFTYVIGSYYKTQAELTTLQKFVESFSFLR